MGPRLVHSDWLTGRVPDDVRAQIRRLVEVLGYLPHVQPLGVVTADAVLLAANQALSDLLGAWGDELLGADWADIMPGWDERVRCWDEEGAEEPRTHTFEERVLYRNGRELWVHVVATPVVTAGAVALAVDGPPSALAAWTVFLSDRSHVRPDEVERRRRETLELLLESPGEFVVRLDAGGRMEFVSPSLCVALGRSAEDLLGQPLDDDRSFAAEYRTELADLWEELARPPFSVQREMRLGTPAGERTVLWTFEALIEDGGVVRGVFGLGHDVTERRRAERALERSELRLRTLVEQTSQMIWVTGPDGAIDSPVRDWMAFTGQSAGEMVGEGWMLAVHADDRERVAGAWRQATSLEEAYECEYRLRRADGEYRWIASRAVPLPAASGGTEYFGVGQDITERRRAEDALQRQLDLETMLASISTRLMAAGAAAMREVFDQVLAEVGRGTDVDRVSMHELAADCVTVACGRAWRRTAACIEASESPTTLADLTWLRSRLEAQEIVTVDDLGALPAEAEPERRLWGSLGLRSVIVAPLVFDGALVAILTLGTTDRMRRWDEMDLRLLRVLAGQITSKLLWYWDEGNLAVVSDCFLSYGPDFARNLEAICAALGRVCGASFVLYDRRCGEDLLTVASWNAPADLPLVTLAAGRAGADVISRGGDDVHVIADLRESAYAHTSLIVREYGLRTYYGYPVRAEGRAVASLSALFDIDIVLRSSQLELFRVLGRAAAVEEARRLADQDRHLSLAQLEQAMERTVATLSGALSTRDPYTAGHERRVAHLAVAIGGVMGMDDADLRLLRLAATVHDIGKIAVPAEILSKPTRLSDVEFAIIKRHSEAGCELLGPAELPGEVLTAVRQHHERLDGSGYPDGLKGDAIGRFARILAVADVAEAMSSNRPYRAALGVTPALEEIQGGAGVRYDAEVCDICVRLFRTEAFSFVE
jgi:PAS domain S-box-containing protein/putative nucleotidyltransferase with HDIG domain